MKPTHYLISFTILSFGPFISCEASNLRDSTEIDIALVKSSSKPVSSDSTPQKEDLSQELVGAPLVKTYEKTISEPNPENNTGSKTTTLPILKSGRDLTVNAEETLRKRQKEAFQKAYEEFERNLISEAVTEVPKRHQSHIDKFNAKMEILPEGVEEFLPESLRPYLNRKIFILKSDGKGGVYRIMLSMVRLLNEYIGLKLNDSLVDYSHKMGRLGFKLKDSVILGLTEEEMRDLAGHAFQIAAQKGEEFVEILDYIPAIADSSVSSAQSFYWAASLVKDIKKSQQLLEKAKKLQTRSTRHIRSAPFQDRENLLRANTDLKKKIINAQSYFTAKEKTPFLPSLYSWNKMMSEIQNALIQEQKKKEAWNKAISSALKIAMKQDHTGTTPHLSSSSSEQVIAEIVRAFEKGRQKKT